MKGKLSLEEFKDELDYWEECWSDTSDYISSKQQLLLLNAKFNNEPVDNGM